MRSLSRPEVALPAHALVVLAAFGSLGRRKGRQVAPQSVGAALKRLGLVAPHRRGDRRRQPRQGFQQNPHQGVGRLGVAADAPDKSLAVNCTNLPGAGATPG